ncbi:MAG: nucleoside hydrolase [Planctomycetia bacterium]|nr:nucleoside hydrolase [Planctomycetia bacterium]
MKKYIVFIILIIFYYSSVFANSSKIKNHIIIDTDGAADDLRTICLLLSSEEIEVIAITTSDGALIPEEGLIKVRALLKNFGHEGIPTSFGENSQSNPPQWRELSQKIYWGDENLIKTTIKRNASDLIISSIDTEEQPVTVICLGSLTNISNALLIKPEIKKGIEQIVWYNNSIHPNSGTNYEIDKKAAENILSTGIRINVIGNFNGEVIGFTKKLLQSIEAIQTPYAQKIAESHRQNEVYKMIETNHLKIWDDLIALYMLYPQLFETKTFEKYLNHSISWISKTDKIEEKIVEILSYKNDETCIVFKQFPDNPHLYRDDVNQYMNQIIENHGKEEWKIIVLTNEFHNHLGIYSIIGAKMGLRAREYFNIGLDELLVVSYAGNRPPISCLNDGLQVSTGATLGHGTISTTKDLPQIPKAIFTFKNTSISLQLKHDYWDIVKKDIKQGIKKHGLLTNDYWLFIRELAIRYWLDWSRKEIFNIKIID